MVHLKRLSNMDSEFIIRTEKAFAYIFCTLTLLLLGLLMMDLIQFISDPSDYAIVYQKNVSDDTWSRSYLLQELIFIMSCILVLGLSIWRLITPNKILRLTVDLIYVIVIIIASIGYYKWYLIGFDH
jgi:hypothetical protein